MSTVTRLRVAYVGCAATTIVIGLWVHLFGAALGPDLRDVLGDALWAVMMLWVVSALLPGVTPARRGGLALAVCFAVEWGQLFHTPAIDRLRATTLGHLVLGSGFDARDLLAYAVGVGVALVLDRLVRTAFRRSG